MTLISSGGIDIWITPHYKIYISQACNGMIPILFLFAAILAYPSGLWHKVCWLVIGYLVYAAVNVARLLWVTYATTHAGGYEAFWWAHDIIKRLVDHHGAWAFCRVYQNRQKCALKWIKDW